MAIRFLTLFLCVALLHPTLVTGEEEIRTCRTLRELPCHCGTCPWLYSLADECKAQSLAHCISGGYYDGGAREADCCVTNYLKLIIIVVVFTIVIACCCCLVAAVIIVRRRQRQKRQKGAIGNLDNVALNLPDGQDAGALAYDPPMEEYQPGGWTVDDQADAGMTYQPTADAGITYQPSDAGMTYQPSQAGDTYVGGYQPSYGHTMNRDDATIESVVKPASRPADSMTATPHASVMKPRDGGGAIDATVPFGTIAGDDLLTQGLGSQGGSGMSSVINMQPPQGFI